MGSQRVGYNWAFEQQLALHLFLNFYWSVADLQCCYHLPYSEVGQLHMHALFLRVFARVGRDHLPQTYGCLPPGVRAVWPRCPKRKTGLRAKEEPTDLSCDSTCWRTEEQFSAASLVSHKNPENGGPVVVRTRCFHCHGLGFNPWSRTKIPQVAWYGQKQREDKQCLRMLPWERESKKHKAGVPIQGQRKPLM